MRWPRVRFTVRWTMVAVAVVGLLLASAIMLRRSREFGSRAEEQADFEAGSLEYADDARGERGDRQRVERGELMATYHRGLKLKYERAARFPWLPVAPDPPEP